MKIIFSTLLIIGLGLSKPGLAYHINNGDFQTTYGKWHRERVSGWLNIGKTHCWRYVYKANGVISVQNKIIGRIYSC